MILFSPPYSNIDEIVEIAKSKSKSSILMVDHLNGFNQDNSNEILKHLNAKALESSQIFDINYVGVLDKSITDNFKSLNLKFDFKRQNKYIWEPFKTYTTHPELAYKNFICSFNGTPHVSRKMLVAILHKFGLFSSASCSKNFTFTADAIDGHIQDYSTDDRIYRKFFTCNDDFFNTVYSFGHNQYKHEKNIRTLEEPLTQSFLHIVSETLATSYYPFVTEKFLYSVVTRGLFVAYAQPGWHTHLEKYYGFKPYSKLFDYRFDSIQNPVERLVELITMVSKFSKLSTDDWKDLYLLELDTVEYNYDWYFTKSYLKQLQNIK